MWSYYFFAASSFSHCFVFHFFGALLLARHFICTRTKNIYKIHIYICYLYIYTYAHCILINGVFYYYYFIINIFIFFSNYFFITTTKMGYRSKVPSTRFIYGLTWLNDSICKHSKWFGEITISSYSTFALLLNTLYFILHLFRLFYSKYFLQREVHCTNSNDKAN